jgi:hypothetical protein
MTRCTPCVLCGTHHKLTIVYRIAVRLPSLATTPLPEITYSVDGEISGPIDRRELWAEVISNSTNFSRFDTSNGAVRDSFHNGTFAGNVGWTPGANTEVRATIRRLVTAAGEPNSITRFKPAKNMLGHHG